MCRYPVNVWSCLPSANCIIDRAFLYARVIRTGSTERNPVLLPNLYPSDARWYAIVRSDAYGQVSRSSLAKPLAQV